MFIIKSLLFISLNIVVCMSEPNPSSNFSVDLFHRYSLESPYYDPSLSPTQIMVDAIRRSYNSSQWLNESHSTGSGSAETDIEPSPRGSYFMRYKIGSREVDSLGLMDTGSDLIWTQCFPCKDCFPQSPPHYKPKESSTYRRISCDDKECKMPRKTVCESDHICYYVEYYAEKTHTVGVLSKDSFTLASAGGTTNRFPGFVFGCSLSSNSQKFKGFESGIVGLGRERLSLVSQLGPSAKGKFSYCMLHLTESRKKFTRLLFGDYSEVLGMEVVRTPLFVNTKYPNGYYVKLFGFSVGGTKFIQHTDYANFVIDSGAVVTRLPDYMYNNLKRYVKKALSYYKTKTDPRGFLDLCFATRRTNPGVPKLTFHFQGDNGYADLTFRDNNMFAKMDVNTMCLLVVSAGEGEASLGSMAQVNFFVEYDTEKKRMSFEATDCAKYDY